MGQDPQTDQNDPGCQLKLLEGVLDHIVVQDHAADVDGGFCKYLKIEFLGEFVDLEHLTVGLDELIQRRNHHIVVQHRKDMGLLLFDLVRVYFVVGDLVLGGANADWVVVLIFGSHKHAGDAGQVDILNLHRLGQLLVIVVHDVHGVEKGLLVALVAAHNLDHPVDHLGSEVGTDLLAGQALLIILCFLIKKITSIEIKFYKI